MWIHPLGKANIDVENPLVDHFPTEAMGFLQFLYVYPKVS